MVVFDPLDGSSNIDAGISVGSIFGVYAPSEDCSVSVRPLVAVYGHQSFQLPYLATSMCSNAYAQML